MAEASFANQIDARFPYDDLRVGLGLAEQGCAISSNAAFMVAEELARPPYGASAPRSHRLAVLDRIAELDRHPLCPLIVQVTRRQIDGEELPVAEAISVMKEIAAYPGQYAALSIAYFACDDVDGEADAVFEEVRSSWSSP